MSRENIVVIGVLVLIVGLIGLFSVLAWRRERAKTGRVRGAVLQPMSTPIPAASGVFPVMTIALIAISVLITLHVGMGHSPRELQYWIIATPDGDGLADVLSGEVWRLITPIFIHFGPMHLLFNMLWLWDLGRLVEARKGRMMFGAFIMGVGILSNLIQYLLGDSPYFGGMSGVVYGLLGYFWIQGRLHPSFGYALNKQTVIMMLGWFVLCWTGLLGPIANWAHTAGLIAGMAWGFSEVLLMRRQSQPKRVG